MAEKTDSNERVLELYKKHRPKVWEDMIGQESTIRSLKEIVLNNNPPTGLLFTGSPGTGKTTAAFIFAKALNCENREPDNPNPCNECSTCLAIDRESQPGFMYVSMANHGAAEDIRRFVGQGKLSQPVKHQVMIFDEVQNMSTQAFDAMLAPLESDSMKTVFILCTTEPEKVREAVKSRTQIKAFTPVNSKELAYYLLKICGIEGLIDSDNLKSESNQVSPTDIASIVRSAKGSVRTALTTLDSFLTTGTLPDEGYTDRLLALFYEPNVYDLFVITEEISKAGGSYQRILESLYREIVLIMLDKVSSDIQKNLHDRVDKMSLLRISDVIGDGLKRMGNRSIDYRILFEHTIVKAALLD